jgi:flagella basal body P-ring formation protein FlgA
MVMTLKPLFASLLAAGLLSGLSTGQALAQVRLKSETTIQGETVRLDQLLDGAGEAARIAVFRAPSPGARGTIRADRIIEAARDMGIHGIEIGEIAAVIVHRPGRLISREDMKEAVSKLAGERGLPAGLDIVLDEHHPPRMVDMARQDAVRVLHFQRDARNGRFEARLSLADTTETGEGWSVTGSMLEMREIAVPIGDLDRGEAIQAKDLVLIKRPASQVSSDIVRPIGDLVGMVPRRALKAGEPIRSIDLAKPILVEKSALVTVTYSTRGLSLAMRGRALGSGSIGDVIKVQNMQSKKVIEGVVSGQAQVSIAGPIAPQASLSDAAQRR